MLMESSRGSQGSEARLPGDFLIEARSKGCTQAQELLLRMHSPFFVSGMEVVRRSCWRCHVRFFFLICCQILDVLRVQ